MKSSLPVEEHIKEREQRVALFDVLFETHRRAVYAFHLGRTGDNEAAADLLQETFVRAWQSMETLAALSCNEQRFWLFRVARNLSIDFHRRSHQTMQGLDENLLDENAAFISLNSHNSNPADMLETQELASRVQSAITQLPPELRTVLTLQVMGDMNSVEIGKFLDRPPGTVRYQINQARSRLMQAISAEKP